MNSEETVSRRLFVGIPLHHQPREILIRQIAQVREYVADEATGTPLSWIPPENYHVTIKFLGATDEDRIPDIISAVRNACFGIQPFKVTFSGLGAFGGRGLRVLWIGVKGADARLRALAGGVERQLAIKSFEPEKREFHPHVTVAKNHRPLDPGVSKPLNELLGRDSGKRESPVPGTTQLLTELALFESVAGAHGVRYIELERIPLVGATV